MSTARYIRLVCFKAPTQEAFAEILEVKQPQISRIESGVPISRLMQTRIIAAAKREGIDFDLTLFFRPLTEAERDDLEPSAESECDNNSHNSDLDAAAPPVTGIVAGDIPAPLKSAGAGS